MGTDQHIEHTFYVGSFEEIVPEVGPDLTRIKKTQVTGNVLHVKTTDPLFQVTEAIEYLHRDHLGSVERITDANGLELQVLAYDPFGERRNSDWVGAIDATEFAALLAEMNIRTSRGFTGHEHLDRTGIIHMNGRIYDPQLGRFLSPDPFVPQPTLAQSWNRYSYVLNNPLSYTDPSGYAEDEIEEVNVNGTGFSNVGLIGLYQVGRSGNLYNSMEESVAVLNAYWDAMLRAMAEYGKSKGGSDDATPESDATKKARERLSGEEGESDEKEAGIDLTLTEEEFEQLIGIALPVARLGNLLKGFFGRLAAVQLGRAGEAAVRAAVDIGPATRITVNGATRIPDGLTSSVLSEVKNVSSLSYTRQLRDFAQHASQNGLRFDLYVRPGAQLSGPLLDAEAAGSVNILEIPF